MMERLDTLKTLAAGATASWAMPAAVDAARNAETLVAGVPASVLLCAVVGVLCGVLILPERDAVRVMADRNVHGFWQRTLQVAKRLGLLAALLLAYAFLAAWVSDLFASLIPRLAGAPQMSLAGISGVVVRRMLPRYLQIVERTTSKGAAP